MFTEKEWKMVYEPDPESAFLKILVKCDLCPGIQCCHDELERNRLCFYPSSGAL